MFAGLSRVFVCLVAVVLCGAQLTLQIDWVDSYLADSDVGSQLVPTKYEIHLSFQERSSECNGSVAVKLAPRKDSQSQTVSHIVLHAAESIKIINISLSNDGNIDIKRYSVDKNKQLIGLYLKAPMCVAAEHADIWLRIEFKKPIGPGEKGLHSIDITDGPFKRRSYTVLDMTGPRMPRHVLPCFDHDNLLANVDLFVYDEELWFVNHNMFASGTQENGVDGRHKNFSSGDANVSLRSLAMIRGPISGLREDPMSIFYAHDVIAPLNARGETLRIATILYAFFANYFGTSARPGKLDIVIWRKLECSPDNDLSTKFATIHSWGLVIGTQDSLLLSLDSTDPQQEVRRTLNLARAIAHQFLGAAHGAPSGPHSWHFESAATQLAVLAVRENFGQLSIDTYLQHEFMSGALDYNTQGSLQLTAEQTKPQTNELYDARFAKSWALWTELSDMIGNEGAEKTLIKRLFELQYHDTSEASDPRAQLLNGLASVSVSGSDKLLEFGRVLNWKTKAPTHDLIRVESDSAHRRILIFVKSIEQSDMTRAVNDIASSSLAHNKRARAADSAAGSSVLVRDNVKGEAVAVAVNTQDYQIRLQVLFEHRTMINFRVSIELDIVFSSGQIGKSFVVAPAWFKFSDENCFVLVRPRPRAPKFGRVAYSDDLLERLARAASRLDALDRVQLVDDLHGLAKLSPVFVYQLCHFMAVAAAAETDTLVLDAYLRLRDSLTAHQLSIDRLNGHLNQELSQALNSVLERVYSDEMLMNWTNHGVVLRFNMRALIQLADSNNSRFLADATQRNIDRESYLPLHAREAVWSAHVLEHIQSAYTLLQRYKQLEHEDHDERERLLRALWRSHQKEIIDELLITVDWDR